LICGGWEPGRAITVVAVAQYRTGRGPVVVAWLAVGPLLASVLLLWVPKTYATWAYAPRRPLGSTAARGGCWRVCTRRPCDDFRLVGLKLIFLIVTRAVSVLGLSRREAWWKDAEILMLRHQLAVALRERPRVHPRLTWPDRAWLVLLAGMLPADRLAAMRLIVTPATILRWHRGIVRRRWARLSRAAARVVRRRAVMFGQWCCDWPVRMSRGATAVSTASSQRSASR
jgi:hypothetical protein